MRDFPVKTPDGKGWERSSMRKSVNPRMVCLPAEQQAGGLYLCMAGKECGQS